MKFFKKKREEGVVAGRLAEHVATFILKIQTAFAKLMSRKAEGKSVTKLKWSTLIFLFTGTSLSIYIAVNAFSKKQSSKIVNFTHLHAAPTINDGLRPPGFFSKSEYQQLQSFDRYLDSLHKVNPKRYDSITKLYPGLLDSVKMLEAFYQYQFQNQK